MAHYIGPDVTSRESQAIHAGINYKFSQFTLTTTASASFSVAMCVIPGGARVVSAVLTLDNDDFNTTGGGGITVQSWTGANVNGNFIRTASGDTSSLAFFPDDAVNGLRHTSSSHAVVKLFNWTADGTGTLTTVFSLSLTYTTQDDKD